MINFIASLPTWLQASAFGGCIITVFMIALQDSVTLSLRPFRLSLSHKGKDIGDIISQLMTARVSYEIKHEQTRSGILRDKMVFAEGLLDSWRCLFLDGYKDLVDSDDEDQKNIEYKMVDGTFHSALYEIKDELRRSFKENGFDSLDSLELTKFCAGKSLFVINRLRSIIKAVYPFRGVLISAEELLDLVDDHKDKIREDCLKMYSTAILIQETADRELKDLEIDFHKKLEKISGHKF